MFEYQTIRQSFIANGDRHLQRANRYLSDGHVEYAQGSLIKAKKNYDTAKFLEPDAFTKLICNALADKVADAIMNGTN